jgi:regulator of RNase E activity RraA
MNYKRGLRDDLHMDTICEFLKAVGTGVLTDAMTVLSTGDWMKRIHPTRPDMKVAGRAFTVRYGYLEPGQKYTPIYRIFEMCRPGDVLVMDASCSDGAMLGEHVIHGALNCGLGGVIVDGIFRDYAAIREMEIPTYCTGYEAYHCPKSFRPVEINVPIRACGALVRPGDYMVGDLDGVVVMPEEDIEDIMVQARAVEKVEKALLAALNRRASMSEILEIGREKGRLCEELAVNRK